MPHSLLSLHIPLIPSNASSALPVLPHHIHVSQIQLLYDDNDYDDIQNDDVDDNNDDESMPTTMMKLKMLQVSWQIISLITRYSCV